MTVLGERGRIPTCYVMDPQIVHVSEEQDDLEGESVSMSRRGAQLELWSAAVKMLVVKM